MVYATVETLNELCDFLYKLEILVWNETLCTTIKFHSLEMRNWVSVSWLLNWSSLFSTVHQMSDRRSSSKFPTPDKRWMRWEKSCHSIRFGDTCSIKVHLAYRKISLCSNGFRFKGLYVIKNLISFWGFLNNVHAACFLSE